ncbi:putative CRIB domain-containing protein RIC2/4 [Helianthus debilis subsp. tardiflorus]
MMKDRMERLVAFPFVTGCVSAASVAVCVQHGRRPKEDIDSSHMVCRSFGIPKDQKDEEGAPTSSDNMMKHSFRFTSLSKPNVSIGLQRLTKSIKNLSQSLVFKDGEMDEVHMELEIGLPTDVKHVAHVGFDGSVTSEANRNNGDLNPSDFLGFCPISFAELEERLAMCAPLDAAHNVENVRPDAIQASKKTEASMA